VSAASSLPELESRLAYDLGCLNYPAANWVLPTPPRAGTEVVDVVVIGAGMAGLAAGFALIRRGIRNIRILDRAPAGREGPWVTFARMQTLRSPKELIGPASGVPSLTFRAWFTARFGEAAWAELFRIERPMWMDYLRWYRRVLALPVENDVAVTAILPDAGLLRLDIESGEKILARKVVLATGRAGLGRAAIPAFAAHLPPAHCAHSSDPIDFDRLRGRRVVVIGVGASAVDNAAEALEHGAAEVRLLIRRARMPTINKLMGVGSPGFTAGFPILSDAWRWRFMHFAGDQATPAPRNSTLRVSRHRNASFHFGCAIRAMAMRDGQVEIDTTRRRFAADFVILGTGFTVEPEVIPELAHFAPHLAIWADRYTPPPDLADRELASFPYLAGDFAFTARHGAVPGLSDLHCFNHAASLSLGKIAGDIPKISDGAALLAESIAASFFARDVDRHFQQAVDYAKPELLGDEWTDAEADADAFQES
jgi:cation diffusion facilitator CzcD-associated flavoprotein CzcO